MLLQQCTVNTTVGEMSLLARQDTLIALMWSDRIEPTEKHLRRHMGSWSTEPVAEIRLWSSALSAYLDSGHTTLHTLAIDPPGTAFQRRVWMGLRAIDYGKTLSYQDLAASIGRPTACRAVANANGKNPMPIVIPCHRAVGADGGIGGFSAGLDRKRWLLRHEQSGPR